MGEIRVGTSGWSYPSGPGAWTGVFYPAGGTGQGGRKVDELAFYADHFDTVEVNSSFYRPPDPALTTRWAARTPAGFDFSLKLFQKFTHPSMYRHAAGLPERDSDDAPMIPVVGAADVEGFRRAVDPLADAGKLAALLAQFPPSFRCSDETRDYLRWLLEAFRGYPLAVELRHRTWSDQMAATLRLLDAYGAAWTQIDEPKFRFSVRQDYLPNQPGLYYMRLHGRNVDQWWTHDDPAERYNYLYSPVELQDFADTVEAVREVVRKIYVYLNNHFAAKAVANAAALRHALGQPLTGSYPDEMVARYPVLDGLVRTIPGQATLLP